MAMAQRVMIPSLTLIGRLSGLNGIKPAGWTVRTGMTRATQKVSNWNRCTLEPLTHDHHKMF